jgi:hypothetical protein
MFRDAILCAGLLAAAASQVQAQAVRLRFDPPVGQVTRYRTVTRAWPSGDTTAAPMMTTLYSTRTIQSKSGTDLVVRTVMDSTAVAMPGGGGRTGMGDMMRGMAIVQHMDLHGRVVSTEVTPPPGLPPQVAGMMQRSAGANENRGAVMPDRPMSPGSTWTDSVVTAAGGGRGGPTQVVFIVTYRLERVARSGGSRLATISMRGSRPDGAAGSFSGEMVLDLDAGRLVHMVTAMTLHGQEGGGAMRSQATMDLLR